jgi:glycosyltransferase involved in cell wall biosynthesis
MKAERILLSVIDVKAPWTRPDAHFVNKGLSAGNIIIQNLKWNRGNYNILQSCELNLIESIFSHKDVIEVGKLPPCELDISVIIPLYNEKESLLELHRQLCEILKGLEKKSYEIIFVDDGSDDGSSEILKSLHDVDRFVEVIRFRRNFGKAAALQAGIDNARGEMVITMDADLQDSPLEIPRFLAALGDDYDVVSGWKKSRQDPLSKTLPSRLFNWVTRCISGIDIHDFNCGFKLYRREVFDHVDLYGELHRYIPVLANWKGYKVTEIPVEHRPREHGHSKYGIERMLKGFFDLLTIYFTRKYESRPLHIYGLFGILFLALGGLILGYLVVLWYLDLGPIGDRPLLLFGILSMLFGAQLLSLGLVAEMLVKIDRGSRRDFVVGERLSHQDSIGKQSGA